VNPRLNRLFAADGRCFDVAVDHGFFGEGSFLAGIEDMARTVATLVEAGPDAIQLSPGQASLLQSVPGPAKPALVLRTDVANLRRRSAQPPLAARTRSRSRSSRSGHSTPAIGRQARYPLPS
jgi:DhnA family fructose-bisphosphate aldolase class Ia